MKRIFKKRNLRKWIFVFSILVVVGMVFPAHLFAYAEDERGYPHSYDTSGGSGSGNGSGNGTGNGSGNDEGGGNQDTNGKDQPQQPQEPQVDVEAEEIKAATDSLGNAVDDIGGELDAVPDAGTETPNSSEVGETVSDAEKDAVEKADSMTEDTSKNEAENTSEENKDNSAMDGDPVRIAAGEYILQETDVKNVSRTYFSQSDITGSFGYGWYSNLDEVILVSATDYSSNPNDEYEKYIKVLKEKIEEFEKSILKSYDVKSLKTGKSEFEVHLNKLKEINTNLKNKKTSATKLLERAKKKSLDSGVKKIIDKIDAMIKKCDSEISDYKARITQFEHDVNFLNQLKSKYEAALKKSSEYKKRYEESVAATNDNVFSVKPGMPKYYYKVGAGKLVYVDGKGTPHIFKNVSGNKYVPNSSSQHDLISIDVSDSSYELLYKDGQKKIFNSNGFLVKIIDRNENVISINRMENGKIASIKTSFGEDFTFTYSGNYVSEIKKDRNQNFKIRYGYAKNKSGKMFLSQVIDDEGDVVRYRYSDDGKLVGVLKNDGSSINIDYNEILSNGKIVTTSTTNEEGFSERFEYHKSSGKTLYTNHDGAKTEYLYDGNNRTIWQKNPDGTEKNFSYDKDGNCVSEITNGNKVTFSYDKFGNRTRADYSDGSRETWSYDKYSLLTEHVDRDGVSEIFQRDGKGNLTKYIVGGKVISSASYNSNGLIKEQIIYGENEIKISYSYDNFGNLIERKIGDRVQKYLYDTNDRIKRVYVNGKSISSYVYSGKKITQTDYNGKRTVYTTNGRKDLVLVEETDTKTNEKRTTRIKYDKRHLPIQKIIGNGITEKVVVERRYTPAGLLQAEMILDGDENYIVVYSYNGDEVVSQVKFQVSGKIDFQNADLSLLQKSANDVSIRSCEKKIEANNKLVFSFTDEIGRTQISAYDAFGNNIEYQNPLSEKTENKFTYGGKIISSQSAYGGFYDFNYDNGKLIGMGERGKEKIAAKYNDDGSVSSVTNRYGEESIYSYNEYGQVKSISSPGKTEWYSYDSFGRLTRYVLGKSDNIETAEKYVLYNYSNDGRKLIISEGGLYETTFELNAFGEVIKKIDGNGNAVGFEYDEKGNRISMTDGYGNTARFEYNYYGQVTKSVDFDGSEKRYYYDSDFNFVKETDALGVVWQGQYDKAGRLILEKGRPGIDRTYEYDDLDRLVCVKVGDVVKEAYTYSAYGREVVYTDGNGNDYHFYNDEFGRIVSEKNRVGDVQNYMFDAEGELKLKRDFNGNETKVSYRNGSKIVTREFADGTSSVLLYDMSGNIISAVNDSNKTVYQYDKGGRMILAADENGGDVIRYEYDAAGNRIRMSSNSSDLVYEYGKNNELLSIVDTRLRTSVKFGYDKCGRETLRELGNGVVQTKVYDKAGRIVLVAEKDNKGKLIRAEGYVYDSLGRQSAKVGHSGAVTLYEYDRAGHLVKVYYPLSKKLEELQREEAEENGLTISNISIGENKYLSAELYNSLGALVANMGGSYGIITSMQVFDVEEYKYDNSDNLVAKTTPYGKIEYNYNAENRLISSGAKGRSHSVFYTYDKNGNLISRESALKKSEYVYSAENRMIYSQVVDEKKKTVSQVHYRYDAFGRRTIVQDSDTAASRTMYDGLTFDAVKTAPVYPNGNYINDLSAVSQYEVISGIRESSTNRYFYISDSESGENKGTRSASSDDGYRFISENIDAEHVYISNNGSPIVMTQVSGSANGEAGSWYFGTDIRGSVVAATDLYGELKGSYSYDAMGRCLTDSDFYVGYGYCGKRSSRTTGLYDYGFRDYDAGVGRFTTMDPVRDGANWFGYCGGDAVNWCDLWGLELTLTVDKEKQTMRVQLELSGYHYETEIQVTTAVVSRDPSKVSNSESKNENGSHWTQFPNGTWNLTGTGKSSNPEVAEKYGIWITTDAHQVLKTDDGQNVDDYGYFIHITPNSNTAGCVGLNNSDVGKNNMNLLLMLYNYNEAMDPNSGKIVVKGDPSKYKNK